MPAWSEALIAYFIEAATDLEDAGLGADDVRQVAEAAARHRAVLDEITEPRLLHGDLWTVNVMIDPDAPESTITGVCDCDRASWGDPLAARERSSFGQWDAFPDQHRRSGIL